jgi:tol-pal system protein YbgF
MFGDLSVGRGRLRALPFLLGVMLLGSACVTTAEFRKLERRVIDAQRGKGGGLDGSSHDRLAEQGAQLDRLEAALGQMEGHIEVLEHRVQRAMEEAKAARVAAQATEPAGDQPPKGTSEEPASAELQAYRGAYSQWRAGDFAACIDQFQTFVKTYPTSDYADDATYGMGECYFQKGNFKWAVLRFDDVATNYPGGNKAGDALYRQGEALIEMGHRKAASNAFEKLLRDYPDSARAPEAREQLKLLGTG